MSGPIRYSDGEKKFYNNSFALSNNTEVAMSFGEKLLARVARIGVVASVGLLGTAAVSGASWTRAAVGTGHTKLALLYGAHAIAIGADAGLCAAIAIQARRSKKLVLAGTIGAMAGAAVVGSVIVKAAETASSDYNVIKTSLGIVEATIKPLVALAFIATVGAVAAIAAGPRVAKEKNK